MDHLTGTHIPTGEKALLQRTDNPDVVKAQFDRMDHEQSHGWYEYPLSEWALDPVIDWSEEAA